MSPILLSTALAAAPPTPAALLAAGACRADGKVESVADTPRPALWIVDCAQAAYQGRYELWWSDERGLRPAAATGGLPRTLLGTPTFDAAGALTHLERARGAGDCGEWLRFEWVGDQLTPREHRARACTDDPGPVPPPEAWPLALEPCAEPDQPVFRCAAGGRELALCGSAGRLQYRFGPMGRPELTFPADGSVEQFTWTTDQLSFDNAGVRYEVAPVAAGAEIRVSRGPERLATIRCTSEAALDLPALEAVVGHGAAR
ncbi:MAG: DUF1176 domain-containing protein [Myxococcota bacterium]